MNDSIAKPPQGRHVRHASVDLTSTKRSDKNSTPLLFNLAIAAFFRAHQWPLRSITHSTINIESIYNNQGVGVIFETATGY